MELQSFEPDAPICRRSMIVHAAPSTFTRLASPQILSDAKAPSLIKSRCLLSSHYGEPIRRGTAYKNNLPKTVSILDCFSFTL